LVEYYEDELSLMPECFNFFNFRKKKEDYENDADDEEDESSIDSSEFQSNLVHSHTIPDEIEIQIESQEHDENNANQSIENDRTKKENTIAKMNKFQIYWRRYSSFTQSPKVHFFYETFFYTAFLLIFSYMLLCDYSYKKNVYDKYEYDDENQIYSNSTNLRDKSNTKVPRKEVKYPSAIEYLVFVWIFAFFLEELIQVQLSFSLINQK